MATASPTISSETLPSKYSKFSFLKSVDLPVLFLSGGFLIAFALMALFDLQGLTNLVNNTFALSTTFFGAYWQVLLLANFFIALYLGFSRYGRVTLGHLNKPEMSTFKWMSVIMCTLLAGGGVFWAAAEPIAHFITEPPMYGDETLSSTQVAYNALAQSFMHWGFLAWAILGSLTGVIFMHLHYDKGLPLKPRTLLYPIFGDKVMKGWLGTIVDVCCVLAVVAGTVGPIGFLGLQVSFGLNKLFGIPDVYGTQIAVLIGLTIIYTISAISGIHRGIQILSSSNVILAAILILFIFLFGPTAFIVDGFINGFGIYINEFIPMATFRGDSGWLGGWTVFFWGWFIGYAPLMAMFVARISRGRTIRQVVTLIAILAPVVTTFWFTVLGGSGLAFEIANPGVITDAFGNFDLPAALFAMIDQLPFSFIISILFLVLTTIFVATTGDSMTFAVSMVMTGTDQPHPAIRIFWGIIMGLMAAILIYMGAGGIGALQSFIVVTAAPVSLILLPTLWVAPRLVRNMARDQGLLASN